MEQLAFLLYISKEERKEVLDNTKPALQYWVETFYSKFEPPLFTSLQETYEAFLEGRRDIGP